jgi:hypothetical protein
MSHCAKCFATGRLWEWKVAPCVNDREELAFWLCDSCDIARNRETLQLLGDPDTDAKIAAYAAQVRAKVD